MWHEPQVVIDTVKRRWPLWVVLIGLWISVVFFLTASIRRNAGVFTYALDDAYIHLAIAKHFVQDGVWGATRYGFSASTSSPGWTLLLSGVIALFGRPEVWPLILNVLFATALLVVVDRLLVPSLPNPFPRFWALLFITLIVPLPILIFSGMEHVLHLLLIATVFGLLWRYEANPLESPRITRWLLVTAMLATLIRYETCFMVGPLVLYYAWRHDWRMTIGLAGAVSIGPVIIGLVQVSHGWYFLPNSLLAKSAQIELTGSGLQALAQRVALQLTRSAAPFVLMLVVAGWIIARQRRRVHGGSWSMGLALSFVAASVAQYVLAQVGWLYRYEAYLILFGCLLILTGGFFPGLVQWFGTGHARLKPWVLAGLGVVGVAAAAIFGYRAIHALDDIVYATRITYNEYYQMARFIDQYYPASTIVVNDIGEIGYQTDARLLDLFALANREPLAAQRNGTFNTGFIDRWTQSEGGQIVIIHDMYYRGDSRLPVGWTQVGTWQVYNHFFDADAIISFYAAIPAEAHELAEHFRSFLPRLAPEVKAVQLVEP